MKLQEFKVSCVVFDTLLQVPNLIHFTFLAQKLPIFYFKICNERDKCTFLLRICPTESNQLFAFHGY
jgi:hypothetical protein